MRPSGAHGTVRGVAIPDEKRCTGKCGKVRPGADFFVIRDARGRGWEGLSAACRECTAERTREWRAANPERRNANARRYAADNADKRNARRRTQNATPEGKAALREYHLKRSYGIGADEYAAMLEAQGGVCAACGEPETTVVKGKLRALAVDHCHRTGEVRALLCYRCNVTLGWTRDDPGRLLDLVEYLLAR